MLFFFEFPRIHQDHYHPSKQIKSSKLLLIDDED